MTFRCCRREEHRLLAAAVVAYHWKPVPEGCRVPIEEEICSRFNAFLESGQSHQGPSGDISGCVNFLMLMTDCEDSRTEHGHKCRLI